MGAYLDTKAHTQYLRKILTLCDALQHSKKRRVRATRLYLTRSSALRVSTSKTAVFADMSCTALWHTETPVGVPAMRSLVPRPVHRWIAILRSLFWHL
jgi:hypothetical protein